MAALNRSCGLSSCSAGRYRAARSGSSVRAVTTHRQPFERATKSPAWTRFATWTLLIAGVAAFVVATVIAAYTSTDSGMHISLVPAALFVVGVAAAVIGLVWDSRLGKRDAAAAVNGTIGQRLEIVATALGEANAVMTELQAQMTAQVAAFDRFYAENEDLITRGDLHRKEAQAVSDLITSTMDSAQLTLAKSHRRGQWLFFALGVLVGIPVVLLLSQFG
jgi:hypothetical protein